MSKKPFYSKITIRIMKEKRCMQRPGQIKNYSKEFRFYCKSKGQVRYRTKEFR